MGAGMRVAVGDGEVALVHSGLAAASKIGATAYATPLILHNINNVMVAVIRRGDIEAAPIACWGYGHSSITRVISM